MKIIWFLATAALAMHLSTTIATAQDTDMVYEGFSNEIEPLNRKARQSARWRVGASSYASAGGGIGAAFGGGGELEAWACGVLCPDDDPTPAYTGGGMVAASASASAMAGAASAPMMGGFVAYRAPRPTKGKFIPIWG